MKPPNERTILVLGSLLFAAYVIQGLAFEWPWLLEIQATDTYKVVSGLGLTIYLYFQWSMRRHRQVVWHKLGGALAPLVLYVHASKFGYGYLLLLGLIYLGTMLIGLLHKPVVELKSRSLFTTWFIVHLSTSIILVMLGGYHVVIALAYE
ncbi:MAG: hypothetical protein WKG01_22810 [Kofleriaceae bacterium]